MNLLRDLAPNQIMQLAKSLDDEGSFQMGPTGLLDLGQLAKTLDVSSSGSMVDLSALTQGRALNVENIDAALYETAEQKTELVWWNLLRKSGIRTVLDQWVEIPSWGTTSGRHAVGKFTDENSFPDETGPTLERKVDTVKFIRDQKSLSQVLEISQNIADPNAILNKAAAITCLEAAEKGFVFGNSDAIPNEFDGFIKKLETEAAGGANTVIDCRKTGSSSGSKGDQITEQQIILAAKNIRNAHGAASDMVIPVDVKSDLDVLLKNSVRTLLDFGASNTGEGLIAGVPIRGYNTPFGRNGRIYFHPHIDTYFPGGDSDAMKPTSTVIGDSTKVPTTPATILGDVAAHAHEFGAGDYGSTGYFYRVEAVNEHGRSAFAEVPTGGSAALLPTSANAPKITITRTATARETCYYIYRSKMDAADASDCRWIADVKCDGASTIFWDTNTHLPGTSMSVMLSNGPETAAVDFRQLLQFVRIALAFGLNNKVGWPYLFLLYGYLRVTKPKMHVLFKNIAFSGSTFWD